MGDSSNTGPSQSELAKTGEENTIFIPKIGEAFAGRIVEIGNVEVLSEGNHLNHIGDNITVQLLRSGDKYFISNGISHVRVQNTKQIQVILKLLKEGAIENKEIAKIMPGYVLDECHYFGKNYFDRTNLFGYFSDLGLKVRYNGSCFYIGEEPENKNRMVTNFSIENHHGKEIHGELIDNGSSNNIDERFKIRIGERFISVGFRSIGIIENLKTLLSGKVLKLDDVQGDDKPSIVVSAIRKLVKEIDLQIFSLTGIGYKIEGPDDKRDKEQNSKKILSAKLRDAGIAIDVESAGKGKTRRVSFEFCLQSIEIIFYYEHFVLFKQLTKDFGTGRIKKWQTGKQERNKRISEINDIFVKNKIPLWINEIYRIVNTSQGDKRVRLGEYELVLVGDK